ncbi:hypothetical protein [Mesorhizobium sp. M1216]
MNAGDAFFADGREFIDAVDETSAWHARQDSNFLVYETRESKNL